MSDHKPDAAAAADDALVAVLAAIKEAAGLLEQIARDRNDQGKGMVDPNRPQILKARMDAATTILSQSAPLVAELRAIRPGVATGEL